MSYSITDTHQFLGKNEKPSWLEQNQTTDVLRNATEELHTRLKKSASDKINSLRITKEGMFPTINVCLKTDNYNINTTIGDLITLYNAEIHAFRFKEKSNRKRLCFDLLVPPQTLAGSISKVRNANEETASWNISITRALEYAGFYPEYALNMSYRDGEIKIWDSSHEKPYRTQRITPNRQNISDETVEKILRNLPDVMNLNIDTNNIPSTISFTYPIENSVEMKSLQYGLSKLPIKIIDIKYKNSENNVYVKMNAYEPFEKAHDRRGSPETVIRKQNPTSYIITLTNALEKSGLVSEEDISDPKDRVSVFARPGELTVREAAPYTGYDNIK